MNAAITILDYLWSLRNTWLRHHDKCECSFEKLAAEHIEATLVVSDWAEVTVSTNFGAIMREKRLTADEWDALCGPAREARAYQDQIDQAMSVVSELVAAQASRERLKGD